jgi:Tfp pilus assembly protein PilO
METLLFICLTLVSCLLAVLVLVVVGVLAAGAWWFWSEQQSSIQKQKETEQLIGQTWQMGGQQAEALEKELREQDRAATYGRSQTRYAP